MGLGMTLGGQPTTPSEMGSLVDGDSELAKTRYQILSWM